MPQSLEREPDTRRSRMRRMPTGKRLVLTPRDMAIFRALSQYRYLRSTYLHAFTGGASETRFKERLGDLFHEGYLGRPETQWRFADGRHAPAVYELGQGGRLVLAEAGQAGDERRVLLGSGAHRQFRHALMICEVLASIEITARGQPDLRFIALPEILAKAPATTQQAPSPLRIPPAAGTGHGIEPDGLFGLEYRSGSRPAYRFFALEIDRETMPVSRKSASQTSYGAKLAAYAEIIAGQRHKRHLGLPNLLVLTVTLSERHKDRMMAAARTLGIARDAFLFKAVPKLSAPAVSLLLEPWQRAGTEAVSLQDRDWASM